MKIKKIRVQLRPTVLSITKMMNKTIKTKTLKARMSKMMKTMDNIKKTIQKMNKVAKAIKKINKVKLSIQKINKLKVKVKVTHNKID